MLGARLARGPLVPPHMKEERDYARNSIGDFWSGAGAIRENVLESECCRSSGFAAGNDWEQHQQIWRLRTAIARPAWTLVFRRATQIASAKVSMGSYLCFYAAVAVRSTAFLLALQRVFDIDV